MKLAMNYQQVLQSLHYRLQRHGFDYSEDDVNLRVAMLALKYGQTKPEIALYIYWLIREGGKEQALAFLNSVYNAVAEAEQR